MRADDGYNLATNSLIDTIVWVEHYVWREVIGQEVTEDLIRQVHERADVLISAAIHGKVLTFNDGEVVISDHTPETEALMEKLVEDGAKPLDTSGLKGREKKNDDDILEI